MKEKILKLLISKLDFEIGLHLLDTMEKKEIYDFFEENGHKDSVNLYNDRECLYALKLGYGASFKTYESRHGFWYISQNTYTCILPSKEEYVFFDYRTPIIYLYERENN